MSETSFEMLCDSTLNSDLSIVSKLLCLVTFFIPAIILPL